MFTKHQVTLVRFIAIASCLTITIPGFILVAPDATSQHGHAMRLHQLRILGMHDHEKETHRDIDRRELLRTTLQCIAALVSTTRPLPARGATESSALLADLPMIRISLPPNGLGEPFVGISICFSNAGPGGEHSYEFMLDSGLTLEMVTPRLTSELHLRSEGMSRQGIAAGGFTENAVVKLAGARLCSTDGDNQNTVKFPDLSALVSGFPQEHIDPKHDPISGMLGQEILSQYDVDLDFPAGRVRFYAPGTAETEGMAEIPAVVLNESGLLGFRLTAGNLPEDERQPVLGVLDCGSSFTTLSCSAAKAFGLPSNLKDPIYRRGPQIEAVGVDGRPIRLPTVAQSLSYCGDAVQSNGSVVGFQHPPSAWKPWTSVPVAVGDLPVFDQMVRNKRPIALVGLDVLAQRRTIIASSSPTNTRKKSVFVSAK